MNMMSNFRILWNCFGVWNRVIDSSGNKTAIFLFFCIILVHLGVL